MPGLALERLGHDPATVAALQGVLEAAPGYFRQASGAPASESEAERLLTELPPGRTPADKEVLGILEAGALVGCVDLVRGHPDPATVFVGLFLLVERRQGAGLGRAAWSLVEARLRTLPGLRRLRLAVLRENPRALSFWREMGFVPTGETSPRVEGSVVTEVHLLDKPFVT